MFEKCISCKIIGERCVPNLWLLPFPELIQWLIKFQKHLGWSNQKWADESNVPVGTINRMKAGDYADCKYSTIRSLAISVMGGVKDEFACTEQVEKELAQMEKLEQQAAKLTSVEAENEKLKERLRQVDEHLRQINEQHRNDIRVIREEYQGQVEFLTDEVKAWRSWHQKQD
jgi:vacuolar-type H+-ATPase subunit I/STV1